MTCDGHALIDQFAEMKMREGSNAFNALSYSSIWICVGLP
jgi:hypothetical protein